MSSQQLFRGCTGLPKRIYDYVVIGAGSGGCAAAATLVKSLGSAASVLLIEAGPPTDSVFVSCPLMAAGIVGQHPGGGKAFNWSLESVPQKALDPPRPSYIPRGCGLGGSSAINAMLYIRGHPLDYDEHWGARFPSWTFAEVLKDFKAMEGNVSLGGSEDHGANGPLTVSPPAQDILDLPFNKAFVAAAQEALGLPLTADFNNKHTTFGLGVYQQTTCNGRRVSAWDAHCARLVSPGGKHGSNFHVAVNSLAASLVLDPKTGAVRAVNVVTRSDAGVVDKASTTSIEVSSGGQVVVALGAIHTPGLLMRSGIGPEETLRRIGVPTIVANGNVGANLMEHFDVTFTARVPSKFRSIESRSAVQPLFGIQNLLRYRRSGTGTFSGIVEYGAFLHSERERNGLSVEAQTAQRLRPDLQLHFLPGPLINHGRCIPLYNGYSLHVCNLYPKSRGTVSLASADPAANPLVDFAYLSEPADVEVMKKGCAQAMDLMRSNAFAQFEATNVNPSPAVTAAVLEQVGEGARRACEWPAAALEMLDRHVLRKHHSDNIYHPMGSCSMGLVVDDQLRVFGVSNLRIADASVIPTPIGGNTNAPCQMIGAKCGHFIARESSL
jgi:choline dehydrogenase-like flavoprotein